MPVTINITKAKDIWKDKIRIARKPKLEELDVEFIKAQETSSDTSAIVAKKQELKKYKSHVELKLMREIKKTIDPNNIMNPGKVL